MSSGRDPSVAALTYASIAGSFAMSIALLVVHFAFGSQLALAQAADSISDMLAGAALVWAVRQAAQPADDDHPLGHGRAEPLAALVVAVLAGVLSVEVLRTAVVALATGAEAELDWPVAVAFLTKVVFKGAISMLASRALARRANPALDALRVDARNDVLVGSVALIGYALARWQMPSVDSVLAIVIAIYVGFAGVRLARENVGLVMGAAAPADRQRELSRIAASVEGVRAIDELLATWSGASLHLYVEIAVPREMTLHAAHDIAHAVQARLAREDDVARVVVHVNPA
ncbi:cation diffusion facilitator family transporter [Sandaracinus amylolyticus]|uniref:cation diffusion facilitator family transporter n=1 Tax=Sandaracinus amylolyticus TaxID=927083 RepID=UPI001F3AF8E7|nr:cation diffusion facilitator family transporter [Sandaracinus amylolyticus]